MEIMVGVIDGGIIEVLLSFACFCFIVVDVAGVLYVLHSSIG